MEPLNQELNKYISLTNHHKKNCQLYADYIDSQFANEIKSLNDVPYLPVSLFKEHELKSVNQDDVYKIMYSSGTGGKQSKIILDKETALIQSKELAHSFKENFGGSRFPMLIIDNELTAKGKTARTAAVNGFSLFGKNRCFALDEEMNIRIDVVEDFIKAHKKQTIFVFGFTFVIYQNLVKPLLESGLKLNLENSFILHGGGWKKLASLNISNTLFKQNIAETLSCTKVHNYYGMVEQTGSIYFECVHGKLHVPHNGSLLIRNLYDLSVNGYGEEGLIQVCSSIQKSYPGHSLLTEDLGVVQPASSCKCGNKGDVLEFKGRLRSAQIRGCSDAI